MSFSIDVTDNFKKEAKRLSKKYPSLKKEIKELGEALASNPTMGSHLGNNVYKIRLAIASKGKGKSGGARIMTYLKIVQQTVCLFSIYDKSEKDSISDDEIKDLIRDII